MCQHHNISSPSFGFGFILMVLCIGVLSFQHKSYNIFKIERSPIFLCFLSLKDTCPKALEHDTWPKVFWYFFRVPKAPCWFQLGSKKPFALFLNYGTKSPLVVLLVELPKAPCWFQLGSKKPLGIICRVPKAPWYFCRVSNSPWWFQLGSQKPIGVF